MFEFILYVSDQVASKHFYREVLQREPTLDVAGMTEFHLTDTCKLGLMPESGIATILGTATKHPRLGNGIPRCELYLRSNDAKADCLRAVRAGATELSPAITRSWGDVVGYVADPDGHILAFASPISNMQ